MLRNIWRILLNKQQGVQVHTWTIQSLSTFPGTNVIPIQIYGHDTEDKIWIYSLVGVDLKKLLRTEEEEEKNLG